MCVIICVTTFQLRNTMYVHRVFIHMGHYYSVSFDIYIYMYLQVIQISLIQKILSVDLEEAGS